MQGSIVFLPFCLVTTLNHLDYQPIYVRTPHCIRPLSMYRDSNDIVRLTKSTRGPSEKIIFDLFLSPNERDDATMLKYPPSENMSKPFQSRRGPDECWTASSPEHKPLDDEGAGPAPLVVRSLKHKVLVSVGGLVLRGPRPRPRS